MSLISNRKANFNYEILNKYTAGIELFGYEVKSIKKSQGSLEGAHITVRGNEAYVVGMFIPPYQVNNTPKEYDPNRTRRLLLSRKEILDLAKIEGTKGLTIVPLSVYNKGGLLKLELATARGKKKFDKRETLKKKDTERQTRREFSDR
jgi:SsrA-binding protein